VRRGLVGVVRDIGTFLQDRIVYSVFFPDANRMVGCREEELIAGDAPWTPTRFEFRDKVTSRAVLQVNGKTLVTPGAPGQVLKVLRDLPDGPAYHVHFEAAPGRVFQVPETMLDACAGEPAAGDDDAIAPAENAAASAPANGGQRPESRLLRHILVTFDNDEEKRAAQILLQDLRRQIEQAPERAAAFAAAALANSHCPTAMQEGVIGAVKPGQLFPELDPPAFALAEGELAGPLETQVGLHILYCERIYPPQ